VNGESGTNYRGLLEAAPDAMVVVNQDGAIVLLNLQAEKRFGYRRDELVGQQVKNIIPEGFAERLLADGLRSAEDALAQQIGTGIELTGRRKDGSEFPIEIMLSPLESAEGILVTAAIRDISVRKDAEKHLAQMEGRYRGLLEAAPDAMVVVNQDGAIVLLNLQAEKRFGYRRDELVGQQVKNIIPEGFAERLLADGLRSAADALAQQIGTGIELTGRRKDGTEFPIEIMLSPLESAEGILVTAAIRDISVRTKAEAHLLQSELEAQGLRNDLAHAGRVATIGELTTSLAHELNQPLTAILSNAQAGQRVLGTAPLDLEELGEILKDIVEDDKRAGEVIRRLRSLLRKGDPRMRALDLNEALVEAARLVSGDAIVRGVSIRLELAAGLPPVRGDRVQLQQVALNLVLNGMDAMQDSGARDRVLVLRTATAGAKTVRVEVRDSGTGISEGDMGKIFKTFYTTKPDGMGMGLAITRSIVDVHGGRLEAHNNPDGGATFAFTLPISHEGT
jgi:PAS domain S-box-containing protein